MATEKKEIWIECFRTGSQTDSAGNTKDWTEADLDNIVDKYNNQADEERHEAPIVLGHPKTDDPAFGWVEELKREGNLLFAKLKDLSKDFVQKVRDGQYKKRSISLYSNMLLKHIGFLGATPPAVKGLADPDFNSSQSYMTFEEEIIEKEINTLLEYASIQTVDDAKIAQNTRSTTYGISVKDINSVVTKPDAYKDLADDSFADPVNYLYPIHDLPNLLSTVRNFDRWDNKYSPVEKQVIFARIFTAAQNFGLNLLSEDLRNFNEEYNKIINYSKGVQSMPNPQEKLHIADEYIKNIANFAKTNFGEEIASSLLSEMEAQKTLIKSTSQDNQAGEDVPQYNESPEALRKIAELERKNAERDKQFAEQQKKIKTMERDSYFKEQLSVGQIVPAQIDILTLAFEAVENADVSTFDYAEKKINREEVLKAAFASFQSQQLLGEFASANNQPAEQFEAEKQAVKEYYENNK